MPGCRDRADEADLGQVGLQVEREGQLDRTQDEVHRADERRRTLVVKCSHICDDDDETTSVTPRHERGVREWRAVDARKPPPARHSRRRAGS